MLKKYVYNWYSVVAFYLHIIPNTTARFIDGSNIPIGRNNFAQFYEAIYRIYLIDNGFSYTEEDDLVLVKIPDGLKLFLYTKKPYSFVLDEIFVMNIYNGENARGKIVIDVGGSIGDTALFFMRHGALRVIAYEPDADRYDLATRNVKLNNLNENIVLFNREATSESLTDLIIRNNLTDLFVKIDCEGCEYQIINEINPEIFSNISVIVIEYHRNPDPLFKKLTKCGFNVKLNRRKLLIYATRNPK